MKKYLLFFCLLLSAHIPVDAQQFKISYTAAAYNDGC
jgi:hypothetical protein